MSDSQHKNEAGIYSYASTWNDRTTSRLNNGYVYAQNEAEAQGKALQAGQNKNPGCSMGALLVMKVEWNYCDKLEAAVEEIARLLGLAPENSSIEDVTEAVRLALHAPTLSQ